MNRLELIDAIADEVVNVSAIAAIGYLAVFADLGSDFHVQVVVGGIVSIALGKTYLNGRKKKAE